MAADTPPVVRPLGDVIAWSHHHSADRAAALDTLANGEIELAGTRATIRLPAGPSLTVSTSRPIIDIRIPVCGPSADRWAARPPRRRAAHDSTDPAGLVTTIPRPSFTQLGNINLLIDLRLADVSSTAPAEAPGV